MDNQTAMGAPMTLGPIKTGNDHTFRPGNIRLRKGETRADIAKLNKIEIRRTMRTNELSYPAMKSLFKGRSVFCYRHGGAIHRAIMKMAEVKRHFVNIHKDYRSVIGPHQAFARKYSLRDVAAAILHL